LKPTDTNILLNPEGRVYHLAVSGKDLADNVLLVGDPSRVEVFGSLLTHVEYHTQNREFHTITGHYHGKPVTILSTGIGTDNIDIVVNELQIAANYDPVPGAFSGSRILNLIRIGTSGALQPEIIPGSVVVTEAAMGLDNLFSFYRDDRQVRNIEMENSFMKAVAWPPELHPPYMVSCSYSLANRIGIAGLRGITLTAPGFYAPQGRSAALSPSHPNLNGMLASFSYQHLRVLNYEMEASALYALGRSIGHKTLTICLILANRVRNEFLSDYQTLLMSLAGQVLENLP
jgi:uridine phosphorylase